MPQGRSPAATAKHDKAASRNLAGLAREVGSACTDLSRRTASAAGGRLTLASHAQVLVSLAGVCEYLPRALRAEASATAGQVLAAVPGGPGVPGCYTSAARAAGRLTDGAHAAHHVVNGAVIAARAVPPGVAGATAEQLHGQGVYRSSRLETSASVVAECLFDLEAACRHNGGQASPDAHGEVARALGNGTAALSSAFGSYARALAGLLDQFPQLAPPGAGETAGQECMGVAARLRAAERAIGPAVAALT